MEEEEEERRGGGGWGADVENPGLMDSCAQSLLDDDSSAVSELFEVLRGGRERQGARGEREEGGSERVTYLFS
jgi:hypothetical protein